MEQDQAIERASKIKAHYEKQLLKLANVTGVGVGFKRKNNQPTAEVAVIVNVIQKKPLAALSQQDIVPAELEGVPVDVQEVGKISAL